MAKQLQFGQWGFKAKWLANSTSPRPDMIQVYLRIPDRGETSLPESDEGMYIATCHYRELACASTVPTGWDFNFRRLRLYPTEIMTVLRWAETVAELEGKDNSDTNKSTEAEMLRATRLTFDAKGIEDVKNCDTYGVYFPQKFSGEEILLYMNEIRSQEPEDYSQMMWALRHHSGKTLAQLETFDLIIISKSKSNRL